MQFESKIVSIDSIDIENTTFKISTPKPIENLSLSIAQFGLLSPPIIKTFHDGYIIISGFHRVYACRKIGWTDIETRVIGSDSKNIDCLKISIEDNAYHRKMNLIEQSIALSKLSSFYGADDEFIRSAKSFGFGDNPSYIKKLLKIKTLIPELQQSILSDVIPLTIALDIAALPKESMLPIIEIFEVLKPTLNQQKEILSMIKEISKIRNCSIEHIINEKNILNAIGHPDFARAQKIKDLRACLYKMRFPNISSYYDQFNALIHELKLPNKVKFIPPENFEDVGYSISFCFDSLQEFEAYVRAFKDLSEQLEFKSIFRNDFANQPPLY
jgi:ParB family transcriptional regulator, chromosome partitioning protein